MASSIDGSAAMLRILHLQRRPAGAQISIERLFEGIRSDLGASVEVEVHVSPCASRGVLPRLRNAWAAWRSAKGRICHITGDVHYLALALPAARTVLTIHDCAVLHRLRGWRRTLIRKLWFEWPVRRAAVVTTISEATREDLKQWLPPSLHDRIVVVPNCVREEFSAAPQPFREDRPIVLQVGTGWNKNVEGVAAALEGLPVHWEMIGPLSPERQAWVESRLPGTKFLGKLDDAALVEAYRRCDVLIFASQSEGFGLPILEAQATGRPVITSRVSPMIEVSGGGALLVNPDKPEEIREALEKLRTDPGLRQDLVEAGWRNVALYRGPAIAAAYGEIYRRLAGAAEREGQGK